MPFNTPIFEKIRADLLRDIKSLNPKADTADDSDYYVRASSIAACASGQYAHQSWIVRQIFPDTADSDFLELHAGLRRIFKRAATASATAITFSGNAGAIIPLGTEIKALESGIIFKTTAPAICDNSGSVTVNAKANETGVKTNIAAQFGQCLSAPVGVQPAVALTAATGGTDRETDASLLDRLLDRLRRPPAGGNKHDYKQWALEIDGVSQAYVYPLRRGLGTVDIAITSAGSLPSAEIINNTQSHIDNLRPVTAKNALVLAPTIKLINITVAVATTKDLATITTFIAEAVTAFFADLAPNDALIKSQLEAVISDVSGVIDRQLTAPAANYTPNPSGVIEWLKLGTVTVTLL